MNKAKVKDKMYMSVGVMKNYKLKLGKLRASHTQFLPSALSKFIFSRIKKKAKTEGKDCHAITM
jgi:hypothetical protein